MSGSVTLGWSALLKPEGLSSCVSADMHLSKYETGGQFTQRERERERERERDWERGDEEKIKERHNRKMW